MLSVWIMIVEIVVVTLITLSSPVVALVFIRVVESESLKVGKSVNIGKKSDKIGKIGFDFLLDLLAKMPKCH